VSLGFTLVFSGMLGYGGGYALMQLAMLIAMIVGLGGGGSMGLLQFLGVLLMIGVIAITLGLVCTLVGQVFWIFTTNKNGSLGLGIGSLATSATYLILFIVFIMMAVFSPARGGFFGGAMMGGAGGGLAVVIIMAILLSAFFGMIFFYTRSVAQTLKDRYLAGRCMVGFIMSAVLGGYKLVALLLIFIIASNSRGMGTGIMVLFMILHFIEVGLTAFTITLAITTSGTAKSLTDR
jgi:hypothetical protein